MFSYSSSGPLLYYEINPGFFFIVETRKEVAKKAYSKKSELRPKDTSRIWEAYWGYYNSNYHWLKKKKCNLISLSIGGILLVYAIKLIGNCMYDSVQSEIFI